MPVGVGDPQRDTATTTNVYSDVEKSVQYNIQKSILGFNQIPWYYSEDVSVTYHQNAKVGKVVALTNCHIVIFINEFTSISGPISTTIYRKSANLDLRALNAVTKM